MGYKVLLAQDVSESGKKLLRDQGYEVILAEREDPELMKELIADCDACFSKTFLFFPFFLFYRIFHRFFSHPFFFSMRKRE